jgi:glycine/D-amino acid oxidase-like deaminating enzyme
VIDVPTPGAARSFWLQEALANDPGEPTPPLEAYVSTDVCIVGGGFAGLWTAFRLTERDPSLRIALVEQDIVGGGASGRNGGIVSASWYDLPALQGMFGETEGLRYAQVLADSVAEIGSVAASLGIDCWFHHDGVLGARTGDWQGPTLADDELPEAVRATTTVLDAEGARAIADSPRFLGGAFNEDSGIVQPARLARGLRRVLLERGVHIFERTPMTGLDRARPAIVRTEHGAVRAEHVVVTTGAWAADLAPFRRSFGVISDYVVATEPMPERLEQIGWTTHAAICDRREWLYYLRPTDDGRIVIGGGAGSAVYAGRGGSRAAVGKRHYAEVAARGLLEMFPQLEGIRFTHAWGGPIDQTPTFVPFFRTLEPGNVHAGLGFSGHGVVQTFVGGQILASTVLGLDDEWTSLAVNRPELVKAPPEPLRFPVVKAAALALERGDAREEAGRSRGLAYDLIGNAPIRYRERVVRRGAGAQ